jgi:hypothetical protein
MNKINFKGKRIIKKENIKIEPNEIFLNPLTLKIEENQKNEPIYLTSFHFNKENKLINYEKETPKNYIDDNKFMLTPPLLIHSNELLKIYNINDINNLIKFIDYNIETKLFDSLNRIINCWIRENFNELVKNNKILIPLYLKLFRKFNSFKVDDKIINKDIELFMIKWFKKKNSIEFKINLGMDLIKYLSNKYEL